MIKMKSQHPLLVDGEARTEFETNEQHARELELSGLAQRVDVPAVEATEPAPATPDSSQQVEAAPPVAVVSPKVKKAK